MGRKRKKKSITLDNIYYTYPYRYNNKSKYYISKKQYKDISKDFYAMLSEMIVNGFTYKLPSRIGEISIVKFKSNKRSIDWKKTNELYGEENKVSSEKKRVYHTNTHSEGYSARWWWEASRWLKFNTLYRFKPTRYNNRYLTKKIKDENSILKYKEVKF